MAVAELLYPSCLMKFNEYAKRFSEHGDTPIITMFAKRVAPKRSSRLFQKQLWSEAMVVVALLPTNCTEIGGGAMPPSHEVELWLTHSHISKATVTTQCKRSTRALTILGLTGSTSFQYEVILCVQGGMPLKRRMKTILQLIQRTSIMTHF